MKEIKIKNQESKIPGPLIVVSGPSGSGKTTVIARLLAIGDLPLHHSVSATTRRPRPGERDGVDYHFLTREQFDAEMAGGALLEWAEVHGQRYGTLRREVEPYRGRGIGVILDIDVQGAAAIRRQCPDTVLVFLRASSMEAYERRLRQRGTEDERTLERRLAAAQQELACAHHYDYQVINDDLDTAVRDLHALIKHQFGDR
ncbi:MAG TPA: guanylate kinase [Gemmataceae bacterium]|nr:guanylate kinase [Gemmataceae bacterium]